MILALLTVGALLAAGAASGSSPARPPIPTNSKSATAAGAIRWYDGRDGLSETQRAENYVAVERLGRILEEAGLFGPGFAQWLKVVAYTEARGNPAAGSDAFNNRARGMFGMRPTTAWNEIAGVFDEDDHEIAFESGSVSPEEVAALKDLLWAIATAAHNASRLRKYTDEARYTMIGARRGWAYPSLTGDHDFDEARSREVLPRWNEALAYFKIPASFANARMRVEVPLAQFPSVDFIHDLLVQGLQNHNAKVATFDPATQQDGAVTLDNGIVYTWAYGQRLTGQWTWAVERYLPDDPEMQGMNYGHVASDELAVEAINAQIDDWKRTDG